MKQFAVRIFLLASLGLSVAWPGSVKGAPTLTVTPAVVTNDWVGKIVLTISGLSAGQLVAVQRWADLNGNGQIDDEDFIVQAFRVTDGRVPRIGGVRNLNQPGDEDGATNGEIRVEVPYPGENLTVDRIAGTYLFKIVDPLQTPSVPLATNTFAIVQKPYAQGVSGTARAADTGLPLTNAFVVLVDPNGPGGYGTFADANGQFTVRSQPGAYAALAMKAGYVASQSAGMVTVVSNTFTAKDLTNAAGTTTISGRVTETLTGTNLTGILMQAQNDSGWMVVSFTDTNGRFSLAVPADQWKVKVDSDSGLALTGRVLDQSANSLQVNTVTGSVGHVGFQFPKATAMVYGTVRDDQSNVVVGVRMSGNDTAQRYSTWGQSGVDGQYSAAVYALDGSDPWNIGPDSESLPSLGYIGSSVSVTISNGQAIRRDFTLHRATTHLRGQVVDNFGVPLGNVRLWINQGTPTNRTSVGFSPNTADDGTFDAGLYGGTWTLELSCDSGFNVVGPTLVFTLAEGVDQNNVVVIAQNATGTLTVNIQDDTGAPVSIPVFAGTTFNGTNYNDGCGNGGSSVQLSVFNGIWQFGVAADLASLGYNWVAPQFVTVSGRSTTVTITLYPLGQSPARLSIPTVFFDLISFDVTGSFNQSYRVEYTTNLGRSAPWTPILTNQGMFPVFDFNPTLQPQRFYRAVRVTP